MLPNWPQLANIARSPDYPAPNPCEMIREYGITCIMVGHHVERRGRPHSREAEDVMRSLHGDQTTNNGTVIRDNHALAVASGYTVPIPLE